MTTMKAAVAVLVVAVIMALTVEAVPLHRMRLRAKTKDTELSEFYNYESLVDDLALQNAALTSSGTSVNEEGKGFCLQPDHAEWCEEVRQMNVACKEDKGDRDLCITLYEDVAAKFETWCSEAENQAKCKLLHDEFLKSGLPVFRVPEPMGTPPTVTVTGTPAVVTTTGHAAESATGPAASVPGIAASSGVAAPLTTTSAAAVRARRQTNGNKKRAAKLSA